MNMSLLVATQIKHYDSFILILNVNSDCFNYKVLSTFLYMQYCLNELSKHINIKINFNLNDSKSLTLLFWVIIIQLLFDKTVFAYTNFGLNYVLEHLFMLFFFVVFSLNCFKFHGYISIFLTRVCLYFYFHLFFS